MKDVRLKVITNILIMVIIAVALVLLTHDFFKGADMRTNTELADAAWDSADSKPAETTDGRVVHLLVEPDSALCGEISDAYLRVLDVTKANYRQQTLSESSHYGIKNGDAIILVAQHWSDYPDAIDGVMDAVREGASLIVGFSPGNDAGFKTRADILGIRHIGQYRKCESLVVQKEMLLGLKPGEMLTHAVSEDYIYVFEPDDGAAVYLTDESGVPIYHTVEYGEGRIGVYNGENILERYYGGVAVGILGTLKGGIAYPIINAGVFFIDDWPGPIRGANESISQQYSMDLDGFLRYVWWPDMSSLIGKYGVKYTGQFMLTYNNTQTPPFEVDLPTTETPMYAYGQQIVRNQGEIGLHGYNHQPLWFGEYATDAYDGYYRPWASAKDAETALRYALEELNRVFPNYRVNSYVPPSNIIDDTGIEVVKAVLGEPVIVSALYIGDPPQEPDHDYTVKDGVIYFPRLTAGAFLDDEAKLQLNLGMGLYGVVSHFIHPDDVIDPQRSHGLDWKQLYGETDAMMAYITERYPYIEFMTVTQAANAMLDWQAREITLDYQPDGIAVTTLNYREPYPMMLLTDQTPLAGDGYELHRLDGQSYFVTVKSAKIKILTKAGE